MAQLLAPYHNGMRLGQGFNSYTQQICLDNAVLVDNQKNRLRARNYYVPDEHNNVTQKMMIDDLDQGHDKREPPEIVPEDAKPARLQPWAKPQIVTYSSRFVDTLRDVTDSMNISGALSVQVGTIGGKGSGSYIDSDKFKESNINFHLQVKVVNQIQKFEDYNIFNKIHNMPTEDFTSVYGDSFISGWEEGGEFNAIVSMKVTDKSKIYSIKADLEVKIGKAGLDIEAKAKGEIDKQSTDKSTETTIAVNWSGGGSIKDPEQPWTIETMTQAAAAFPDLVAMCPQRTYAILTKYTALESFQRQMQRYSPLDYENSNIITTIYMEHFMEYKMLMKQISQAVFELQRGNAKADFSEISSRLQDMARVKPLPSHQMNAKLRQTIPEPAEQEPANPKATTAKPESAGKSEEEKQKEEEEEAKLSPEAKLLRQFAADAAASARQAATAALEAVSSAMVLKDAQNEVAIRTAEQASRKTLADNELREIYRESIAQHVAAGAKVINVGGETRLQFTAFYPDFDGLIAARKVCRYEMAKIVNEVDLLTKYPKLALDTSRDEFFLEPVIFRQLLPIVRTWTDDMLPEPSQADAPIILGYVPRVDSGNPLPDVYAFSPSPTDIHTNLKASINKVQRKARNYRMLGLPGRPQEELSKTLDCFNDLELLEPTYRPQILAFWTGDGGVLQGIQITYANGVVLAHGLVDLQKKCHWICLAEDGSEVIFEMQIFTDSVDMVIPAVAAHGTMGETGYVAAVAEKKVSEVAVCGIRVVTTKFNILDSTDTSQDKLGDHPNKPKEAPPASATPPDTGKMSPQTLDKSKWGWKTRARPENGTWSLRGFFGFIQGQGSFTRFSSLGEVWGKDKFVPRPPVTEKLPICKTYFPFYDKIRQEIAKIHGEHEILAGKFFLGDLAASTRTENDVYFNHLRQVKVGWKIKTIKFGVKGGKLAAIETTWSSGKSETVGKMPTTTTATDKTWECEVAPNLLMSGKISRSKVSNVERLATVEFIRSEGATGALPPWLLNVSTLRYIGDGTAQDPIKEYLAESAPDFDGAVWSIRGFHGTSNNDEINALGFIWGRD